MTAVKWAKALSDIRKGENVICPDCGKATIQSEYLTVTENTDGMVVLSCSNCGKIVHFPHQKKL